MLQLRLLFLTLALPSLAYCIQVDSPTQSPQVTFAIQAIQKAALNPELTIKLSISNELAAQSYSISRTGNTIHVTGGDDSGLMYGGLEIAERLQLNSLLQDGSKITGEPHIQRRGLKMNIPLDARCPSYDDTGTSATMNIEQVWSTEFWHEFLDQMALHRFNTLSLWSNHPFTAMLSLEEYPDVAIHDVAIPTYEMDDKMLLQYKQGALQDPKNYKVVKRMTIDEKVAFWQHVMSYAQDRGIDIYFLTWNIWVHGAEGKYGINTDQTNDATIAYLRECVKQFVLTYPDLKGLGITCGEHMQNKLTGEYRVGNWMWNTYGKGILDAKAEDPNREVHFIHRIWYSGMQTMIDDFIGKYPDPIDVSFKYARARLYSIPNPPFFKDQLQDDLEKHSLKTWLNLRNDDIFQFRWGDPDYVREYINNMPDASLLAGFIMGSDGYVWGREFASKHPQSPRQLEIDKHWYKFMLWGRLAYNPSLSNAHFKNQIANRFPSIQSDHLFNAWQTASQIIPIINTWHWRDWDHMWSPETCISKKEGYHSINHFIEFKPLAGQSMQSIPEAVLNNDPTQISPLTVAEHLDTLANSVTEAIEKMAIKTTDLTNELNKTIADIEAFASLAQYYAAKIRGSYYVHKFRVNGVIEDKQLAIQELNDAVTKWKAYAAIASELYEVQLYARTSYSDWNGALLDYARQDIEIAKAAEHNVFPESVLAWKKLQKNNH